MKQRKSDINPFTITKPPTMKHRKAKRADRSIPPFTKVDRDLYGDKMTGFTIIVGSYSFKAVSGNSTQRSLWVHFERRFPSRISWEPRLRLEAGPSVMASVLFGPPETSTVLPQKVDTVFERLQCTDKIRSDPAIMCRSSCKPSHPPLSAQEMMDVGWGKDEARPD
ncbi:Uu.00g018280.m01.CDS01 [Anthostomella pinea]|uniref:Uu.00g018280.m01.CDS01 n=1 Tax=Anthostomella pinea TaxID=933095 RepID=A0AAI8VZQ2_9PEZI|nr:Uu.00g018280.m01.CDS01 [Anthostomella pinea]